MAGLESGGLCLLYYFIAGSPRQLVEKDRALILLGQGSYVLCALTQGGWQEIIDLPRGSAMDSSDRHFKVKRAVMQAIMRAITQASPARFHPGHRSIAYLGRLIGRSVWCDSCQVGAAVLHGDSLQVLHREPR